MGRIYSEIRSGLGNQLFQFAFGYAMASEFNKELILCPSYFDSPWKYSLKKILGREARSFRLPHIIKKPFEAINQRELKERVVRDGFVVVKENETDIQKIRLAMSTDREIYLLGYWQNPKLFSAYKEPLTQLIEPSFSLSKSCRKILNNIDENFIGAHVRRGDFLTNRSFGACTSEYYIQAIQQLTKTIRNPKIVVFTNDKGWVSRNFPRDVPYEIYESTDKNTDIEELYLMTKFNALIISNSTFSWWAAYLNHGAGRRIISPSQWFLKEELQKSAGNFISHEWTVLNNQLELKN